LVFDFNNHITSLTTKRFGRLTISCSVRFFHRALPRQKFALTASPSRKNTIFIKLLFVAYPLL
jgi:hypothetical protein